MSMSSISGTSVYSDPGFEKRKEILSALALLAGTVSADDWKTVLRQHCSDRSYALCNNYELMQMEQEFYRLRTVNEQIKNTIGNGQPAYVGNVRI